MVLDKLRDYLYVPSVPEASIIDEPVQAAVLVALTDNSADPSVVLTKRAETLNSHSGQVSLPGGKCEPQDPDLLYTALRETHEEIGLSPESVQVLGALPTLQTYQGLTVSPFVGIIPEGVVYKPNAAELDAIFHVPLSFFISDQRIRTDIFERKIGHSWSPAYEYEGFEIWGFTARLLSSYFSSALDLDITKDNPAPVKHWPRV